MARPTQDLTGQKFGNLTVIERKHELGNNYILWLCKCDCGRDRIIRADNLKSGHTKTCGFCSGKRNGKNISITKYIATVHHMAQGFADYINNSHEPQCVRDFVKDLKSLLDSLEESHGVLTDEPGECNYTEIFSNYFDEGGK